MAVMSRLGSHCRSGTAGSFETLAQQSFDGPELFAIDSSLFLTTYR